MRRQVRNAIGSVCEELLMNALYDAPVDADGKQVFAEVDPHDRTDKLSPRPVSIRYAATEDMFAVAVRDRFGRLAKNTILSYIDKCIHSPNQIDRKTYGAGLGLYLVANAAASYVVNVAYGIATEVVCTFDRGAKSTAAARRRVRPPRRRRDAEGPAGQSPDRSGARGGRRGRAMAERQFGPYRLVRQIAVGGMAEIHLAKTKGIAGFEKYVALKMIHPNFAEDEQFIQMLVDEAKIAVQLTHGNIAQTFDLGRVGDTYYITMEYVDGADLYKILRRGSEIDLEMPLDVCAFVGKGGRERARSRAPQEGSRRQAARHRAPRRVAAERPRLATRARSSSSTSASRRRR